VGGYAPRAREDSVRPRRLIGGSVRPLSFTVRCHVRNVSRLWRLWAILTVSTAFAGCDIFGFNRTPEVAKTLLFRPDGKLDAAAASAAMNARFPPGSNFGDLQSFAQSLGGRCNSFQGRTWCNIPLRGVFCDTRVMSLSVVMGADDAIEHIQAREIAKTC
jgi:hypothetical protein